MCSRGYGPYTVLGCGHLGGFADRLSTSELQSGNCVLGASINTKKSMKQLSTAIIRYFQYINSTVNQLTPIFVSYEYKK